MYDNSRPMVNPMRLQHIIANHQQQELANTDPIPTDSDLELQSVNRWIAQNTNSYAAVRQAYDTWLSRYQWEAFLTMRHPKSIKLDNVHDRIKKHIKQVSQAHAKCPIAGISFIARSQNVNHSHTLLLPYRTGSITGILEDLKYTVNCQSVFYTDPNDNQIAYAADHIICDPTATHLIEAYGIKILKSTLMVSR